MAFKKERIDSNLKKVRSYPKGDSKVMQKKTVFEVLYRLKLEEWAVGFNGVKTKIYTLKGSKAKEEASKCNLLIFRGLENSMNLFSFYFV